MCAALLAAGSDSIAASDSSMGRCTSRLLDCHTIQPRQLRCPTCHDRCSSATKGICRDHLRRTLRPEEDSDDFNVTTSMHSHTASTTSLLPPAGAAAVGSPHVLGRALLDKVQLSRP